MSAKRAKNSFSGKCEKGEGGGMEGRVLRPWLRAHTLNNGIDIARGLILTAPKTMHLPLPGFALLTFSNPHPYNLTPFALHSSFHVSLNF
jgi:hypothetical protein